MKRLILIFREGRSAMAVSLTAEDAILVVFRGGKKRVLGELRVPPGLIQFAGSSARDIRLGLYVVNGEQVAMVFDRRSHFGYALNLTVPAHSEWGMAPDEVAAAGLAGRWIATWRNEESVRDIA